MRRLARALLASLRSSASSSGGRGASPPRNAPPLPAATATPGGARPATEAELRALPCLDVRPPDSLSAGIVPGSWVLPRADALRLAAALPRPLVVLAPTDADALATTGALGERGCDAMAAIGGLLVWGAVGRPLREPAWKSPLPTGYPIRLEIEPKGATGWVQEVRWRDTEFRFDVVVEVEGALVRIADLPEEALAAHGARGAAGLGVVF